MKKQITLRIDEEVLDWFKSQGRGYQTRMNGVLRHHMDCGSVIVPDRRDSELDAAMGNCSWQRGNRKPPEKHVYGSGVTGDNFFNPMPKK